MRRSGWLIGVASAVLLAPSGAHAVGSGTVDSIALPSPAGSVTIGPDGLPWVSLPSRHTVAHIANTGAVIESVNLNGQPAGLAVVAGKVWVALTDAHKIAIIDPTNASAVTTIATPAGSCGPLAIADGGNGRAYVSLPDTGDVSNCGPTPTSKLAIVNTATNVLVGGLQTGRGTAYDLVVSGGKLWIPDYDGDVVHRAQLSDTASIEATFAAPGGSSPNGIAVGPDGSIVTTLFGAGALARVVPSAAGGPTTSFATGLIGPFGVATVGGSIYAASAAAAPTLQRYPADGSAVAPIALPSGTSPFDVAAGPDGDVLVSDSNTARLIRFTSRAPRASAAVAAGVTINSAAIPVTVNPGGNATTPSIEYGTTPTFAGSSTATGTTASGIVDAYQTIALNGLASGTTYYYRVIASSPEGSVTGPTGSFTTVAPSAAAPQIAATVKFTSSTRGGVTRITKIRLSGLLGGESIKITCAGKGCPAKKKQRTVKAFARKPGSFTVDARQILGAKLRKGAVVTVTISKQGFVSRVATATAQAKKKKPIIQVG